MENIKPISSIFKYINPKNNTKFSELSGSDLADLLILIDDHYLELRTTLGIDEAVTFGVELEFEKADRYRIDDELHDSHLFRTWPLKNDVSLCQGAEIASPILKDKIETWKELREVCDIISKHASIGTRAGGHIHIGAHILDDNSENWLNFIRLWSVYENIAFRFGYGNFLAPRPSITEYAKPVASLLDKSTKKLSVDDEVSKIISFVRDGRYNAVNFENVSPHGFCKNNTIEFRSPNATLDAVIWQNNINFFIRILEYCKNKGFDLDTIENRRQKISDIKDSLEFYGEIFLEQAIELSDMIFDNNLEKIYFLRQYLKSFGKDRHYSTKSSQFTKK